MDSQLYLMWLGVLGFKILIIIGCTNHKKIEAINDPTLLPTSRPPTVKSSALRRFSQLKTLFSDDILCKTKCLKSAEMEDYTNEGMELCNCCCKALLNRYHQKLHLDERFMKIECETLDIYTSWRSTKVSYPNSCKCQYNTVRLKIDYHLFEIPHFTRHNKLIIYIRGEDRFVKTEHSLLKQCKLQIKQFKSNENE